MPTVAACKNECGNPVDPPVVLREELEGYCEVCQSSIYNKMHINATAARLAAQVTEIGKAIREADGLLSHLMSPGIHDADLAGGTLGSDIHDGLAEMERTLHNVQQYVSERTKLLPKPGA